MTAHSSASITCASCASCGEVSYPVQPFGCPNCGAEPTAFAEIEVPAAGTLVAWTIIPAASEDESATSVADIRLDGGPVVTAQLDTGRLDVAQVRSGMRVAAAAAAGATYPIFAAIGG